MLVASLALWKLITRGTDPFQGIPSQDFMPAWTTKQPIWDQKDVTIKYTRRLRYVLFTWQKQNIFLNAYLG